MNDPTLTLIGSALAISATVTCIGLFKKWVVEKGPCLHLKPIAKSLVEDHEGPCAMTWCGLWSLSRLDGGVTGFFRNVRKLGPLWVSYGPEFHGIARFGTDGKIITSTKMKDPYPDDF